MDDDYDGEGQSRPLFKDIEDMRASLNSGSLTQRVVNFPEEIDQGLRTLAQELGVSKSDLIRESVRWALQEIREGRLTAQEVFEAGKLD